MIDSQQHIIGLVFYPGMTSLDIIGPQQVFSGLPGVQIHRLWKTLDPVKTDDGMMVLPDTTLNLTDVTNAMNGQISAIVSTIGGMPQDGQRADFLGNKQSIDRR